MTKEVNIPILQAGMTASELMSLNPIGLERQLVLETDTRRAKVLDGVTNYNDLPYWFESGTATVNWGDIGGNIADQTDLATAFNNVYLAIDDKQDTLVNQVNIRSINGNSLLGSGDITVSASISIGTAIGSATAGSILFAGASGVLAQDSNLQYSSSTGFQIGATGNFNAYTANRLRVKAADNSGNTSSVYVEDLGGSHVFSVLNNRSIHIGPNQDIISTSSNSGYFAFASGGAGFSFDKKVAIGFNGIGSTSLLHIKTSSATDIGLIVQGTTSQSGNLLELRDVSNNIVASISPSGNIKFGTDTNSVWSYLYGPTGTNGTPYIAIRPNSNGNTIILETNHYGGGQSYISFGANLAQEIWQAYAPLKLSSSGPQAYIWLEGTQGVRIPQANLATSNYGRLSIGDGAWDGSTSGYFVGSASGTLIAGNLISGSASDLINLQVAGASMLKVTNAGNTTLAGTIRFGEFTVATLPSSPSVGDKCFVNDASGAAVVGSIVVGGGATRVEVVWSYGGAGWKITARY